MCNLSYVIDLTLSLTDVILNLYIFNILEIVFVFFEILFAMVLFKGGVLIFAEHCIYVCLLLRTGSFGGALSNHLPLSKRFNPLSDFSHKEVIASL